MNDGVTGRVGDASEPTRRIAELEEEVAALRRLAFERRDLELGLIAKAQSADWLLRENDLIRSGFSWKAARAATVPVRLGQKVARRLRSAARG